MGRHSGEGEYLDEDIGYRLPGYRSEHRRGLRRHEQRATSDGHACDRVTRRGAEIAAAIGEVPRRKNQERREASDGGGKIERRNACGEGDVTSGMRSRVAIDAAFVLFGRPVQHARREEAERDECRRGATGKLPHHRCGDRQNGDEGPGIMPEPLGWNGGCLRQAVSPPAWKRPRPPAARFRAPLQRARSLPARSFAGRNGSGSGRRAASN